MSKIVEKSDCFDVSDYFDQLIFINNLTSQIKNKFVIYGGDSDQNWPYAKVLSWQSSRNIIYDLEKK